MNPELLAGIRDYGPLVLAAVGAAMTTLFGIIAFLAKLAWKQHQERVLEAIEKHPKDIHAIRAQVKEAVDTLGAKIAQTDQAAKDAHQQIRTAVIGLREGLKSAVQADEQLKLRVAELAGVVGHLGENLEDSTGQLQLVNGKLEAVFRFIDAAPRPTDVARPKPTKG